MTNLRDFPYAIGHRELMLATPGKLFASPGWVYELKYDGYRVLACKRGDVVRLQSRSGRDLGRCFPELVDHVRAIAADVSLDGELVMLDETGRPRWEWLKGRHALRDEKKIQRAAAALPAAIFAFDLLHLRGADTRPYPLRLRKALLADVLARSERVLCVQHMDAPTALWELATQFELEGIMAKDAESAYSAGRTATRIHDWRNYINLALRSLWSTFTSEQRAAIGENAQQIADGEEWE